MQMTIEFKIKDKVMINKLIKAGYLDGDLYVIQEEKKEEK